MKICVISPFVLKPNNPNPQKNTLNPSPASSSDILDFIESICCDYGYDFIALAGNVNSTPNNANRYPSEAEVQTVLKYKGSSATVFIETSGRKNRNYPPKKQNHKNAFFVSASKIFSMPEQVFSHKIIKEDIHPRFAHFLKS